MAHPKGVLLERAAKLGLSRPEFRTERSGPEHEPLFLTDVIIDGEVLGTGQGGSKRTAEKNAADEALAALEAREGAAAQGAGPGRRGVAADATPAGKRGAADAIPAGKRPAKAPSGGKTAAREAGLEPVTEPLGGREDEPADEHEDEQDFQAGEPAGEPRGQPAYEREYQQEDEMASDQFEGPWPMFDDLLAAVLVVAEKRVATDLRGEAARAAIRDFSLALYKDLLGDLGDVVEEDGEGDEED